jgi:hypothetical protein
MAFGTDESRVHFGDIHGVGLNHLQLFFGEVLVVDVRCCQKMFTGPEKVLDFSAIRGEVGHNKNRLLTAERSAMPSKWVSESWLQSTVCSTELHRHGP